MSDRHAISHNQRPRVAGAVAERTIFPPSAHWRSPKTEGAETGDKTILLVHHGEGVGHVWLVATVDHRMKTCLPAPRLPGTWNENARRANTGNLTCGGVGNALGPGVRALRLWTVLLVSTSFSSDETLESLLRNHLRIPHSALRIYISASNFATDANPMARYGAVEFARAEDTWGFLADGSATYELVKGIVRSPETTPKRHPHRNQNPSQRRHVGRLPFPAHQSQQSRPQRSPLRLLSRQHWETQLPTFKTAAEQNVYQRLPDGTAILDGYPIVWTDVLQAYTTSAAPDTPIAVFAPCPSGGWASTEILASTPPTRLVRQRSTRRPLIEEIDFDYAATDATAALITAAS